MKTTKPGAPRATKKKPPRQKSGLTEIGEAAMRAALLATLEEKAWNLTHASEALRMGGPSTVIRALRNLGLAAEYERARKRGDIVAGRRPST